tara:strand:- start:154 stop:312 length:159 start_codon:yes stop_codon:yes gene_type:complete
VELVFVVKVIQEVNFQLTQLQVVVEVEQVLPVRMEQPLFYQVAVDPLTVEQD